MFRFVRPDPGCWLSHLSLACIMKGTTAADPIILAPLSILVCVTIGFSTPFQRLPEVVVFLACDAA